MNPLFTQMSNQSGNQFLNRLNELKRSFNGDPNQYIQQLLNSGKVSQQQYNSAVQMANQIMKNMR
jgi:vancomycin permeability regulator SanA